MIFAMTIIKILLCPGLIRGLHMAIKVADHALKVCHIFSYILQTRGDYIWQFDVRRFSIK